MNFLKEELTFLDKQLHGNISNRFKFTLKELFRTKNSEELPLCKLCSNTLLDKVCYFCEEIKEQKFNKSLECRNINFTQAYEEGRKGKESMILCVDISGSMNCTYPSRYSKMNKEYVIRAIGKEKFDSLSKALKLKDILKNFDSIMMFLDMGESINDVILNFRGDSYR